MTAARQTSIYHFFTNKEQGKRNEYQTRHTKAEKGNRHGILEKTLKKQLQKQRREMKRSCRVDKEATRSRGSSIKKRLEDTPQDRQRHVRKELSWVRGLG